MINNVNYESQYKGFKYRKIH